MSVEAPRGTDESSDPFLAEVRPYQSQVEPGRYIYGFLRGARLRDYGLRSSFSSIGSMFKSGTVYYLGRTKKDTNISRTYGQDLSWQ